MNGIERMTGFAGGPQPERRQEHKGSASSGQPVLLLGWQPQLGQAAIARGFRPVVLYGPVERDWAGVIPEPDCLPVYCADPARLDASLSALLRSGIALSDFAAVCSAGEPYVIAASEYACLLGLPGLPLPTAVACRDKAVQKSLIRDADLPCAEFRVIPDPEHVVHAAEDLDWDRYPAVLKPVAGSSAIAVDRVASDAQARAALRRKDQDQLRSPHLIEEFIESEQEWHLDGFIQDGEIKFLSIGVYAQPLLTMRNGIPVGGILLDPNTDAESFKRASVFMERVLESLQLTDSVFHAEVFVKQGSSEFIFGECAARPAGSSIPQAVLAKHGVDLFAAHLELCLGRRVTQRAEPRGDCVAYAQLNTKPGVLIDHPSTEDLLMQPGVVYATLQYPRGWSLPSSRDGTNFRMGCIVVTGRDQSEVRTHLSNVSSWFDRNLRVGPAKVNSAPAWTLRRPTPF